MEIAIYRRNSLLADWPVLEVVGVSAVTAAISYLVGLSYAFEDGYSHHPPRIDCIFTVRFPWAANLQSLATHRVQSSELVANLFQECDLAKGDYHGLCK